MSLVVTSGATSTVKSRPILRELPSVRGRHAAPIANRCSDAPPDRAGGTARPLGRDSSRADGDLTLVVRNRHRDHVLLDHLAEPHPPRRNLPRRYRTPRRSPARRSARRGRPARNRRAACGQTLSAIEETATLAAPHVGTGARERPPAPPASPRSPERSRSRSRRLLRQAHAARRAPHEQTPISSSRRRSDWLTAERVTPRRSAARGNSARRHGREHGKKLRSARIG